MFLIVGIIGMGRCSMMEIKDTLVFLNRKYPSVKNYIYTGHGNIEDFGILKCSQMGSSVYIVQDRENKELGYRVYKSFAKRTFNKIQEPSFLQKLHDQSKSINIDLPYGVITQDDRIIGQVIPYYEDGCELIKYYDEETNHTIDLIIDAFQQIRRLYDNGIFYMDIHGRNFLVTKDGIKIIDYDRNLVTFKSGMKVLNDFYKKQILMNFSNMTRAILNIHYEFPNLDRVNSLDELQDELFNIEKQYVKIKKR